MIEPSSDEEPDQSRGDDDPAKDTDLTDEPHHGRLPFRPPKPSAFLLLANSVGHPIRRGRLAVDSLGVHGSAPNMPASLGPQIPHDLSYGLHLQSQAFGARGSLSIERFVELRQDHLFETSEIVTDDRFACCDRNFISIRN